MEVEKINPKHNKIQFCKAFCADLISREDDIESYLDLVSNFPDIDQNYFHVILLYLKSGNHEGVEKVIDLYVSLFNDFDPKALLIIWVTFSYINFQQIDRMNLYLKRLECLKDNKYVYDFYTLNKSIMNINYNTNIEEAEFMLENLYNETANLNVKLVAGVNLIFLLESRSEFIFRIEFMQRVLTDFRDYIDCYDLEKKYQKLRADAFEINSVFALERFKDPRDCSSDDQNQVFYNLLHFPINHASSSSLESVGNRKTTKLKVKSVINLIEKFNMDCSVEEMKRDEIEETVNDYYFRCAFEAIEELMDPANCEKIFKSIPSYSDSSCEDKRVGSLPESFEDSHAMLRNSFLSLESLFKKAVKFLSCSDVVKLKETLLKIHKTDSKFKETLVTYSLGQIYYDDDDYDSALYFLLLNYEVEINKIKCLVLIGKTFEKLKDERKAIITYNKLNSMYIGETIGYYQIGKLFFKKGENDIAADNFNRVITIDPLNYKSHVYLSLIYRFDKLDSKKMETILYHLHQAKDETLHNRKFKIMINQNFAEIYEEEKNYDLAIKYYMIVLNLQPNNIDFLLRLADLHLKKKKYVTALNNYLDVHSIDPRLVFAINQVANLYAYLSKYEESIRFFKLLLEEEPDNLEIILLLGQIHRDKLGQLDKAIKVFQTGIGMEGCCLAFYEVSLIDCAHLFYHGRP